MRKNLQKLLKIIMTKKQINNLAFIICREDMEDTLLKNIDFIREILHIPDIFSNKIIIIDDTLDKVKHNPEKNYIIIDEYNPDMYTDDSSILNIIHLIKNKNV